MHKLSFFILSNLIVETLKIFNKWKHELVFDSPCSVESKFFDENTQNPTGVFVHLKSQSKDKMQGGAVFVRYTLIGTMIVMTVDSSVVVLYNNIAADSKRVVSFYTPDYKLTFEMTLADAYLDVITELIRLCIFDVSIKSRRKPDGYEV